MLVTHVLCVPLELEFLEFCKKPGPSNEPAYSGVAEGTSR